MDRFEALQTFVAVVEAGQFNAAAERLGCNNSAVSRRIAELENRLGAQLLTRTTRRLALTDAGRALYERAVRLLAELEETEQSVAAEQAALTGRLRLATPLSFGLLHLPSILNAFMAEHPGVELDIRLDDREVNLVEEGVDLALRIGHLADSSLVARPLAPIRFVTCASPGYLARHGVPREPADLARHACLVYGYLPEPQLWRYTGPDGGSVAVRVPLRMRANNGDLLLSAAAAGLGVCLQPTFLAYRAVLEGRLTPLLPGYTVPAATAYAVYPSRRHLPRRVRALIDFLANQIGARPYWDEGLFDGGTESGNR